MALSWININAITQQRFIPAVIDQIYKSNPLFLTLLNKGRVELRGGADIREPLLTAAFPVQWIQFHDQIDVTAQEFLKNLVLDWALAVVPGVVSEQEIMVNAGETRVMDIVAATLDNMRLSLEKGLAEQLWSPTSNSNNAKAMVSLFQAIDDGVTTAGSYTPFPTYANINRTTDTYWRSVVIDLANADLTIPVLNDAILRTSIGNTSPDLVVTSKKIYNKLWVNVQSQQRFPEGDDVLVGWQHIKVGNTRVVWDDYAPDDVAFGLNTDFVKLIVHPDGNFRFEGWRVPHNQLSRVGFLIFMGQLLVNGCRYHFKILRANPN